ncbi:hypothetical protein HBI80_226630 [Parastagonospora nodorum]|nr:hypothetical protein HBI80_226630 [Parastagonospora nodorum]KAH6084044.1 hypothetical protein HBI65_202800 [Parastagonospora nodorum]
MEHTPQRYPNVEVVSEAKVRFTVLKLECLQGFHYLARILQSRGIYPYANTFSFAVYQPHHGNLTPTLNDITLIDTYLVDPNPEIKSSL